MNLKTTAARAILAGAVVFAALVLGAGLANAESPLPTPPPPPSPTPAEPGIIVGGPGNPVPPGRIFVPPPGHSGPISRDAVAPEWAPPVPPPPSWAPWLPVVWNSDVQAWGVWWNGLFITL
jgi:hypothetical protein